MENEKNIGNLGRTLLVVTLFVFMISFASSAHWMVGYVEDARDGELANNHVVMIWNPAVGVQDNTTDIIGPNGRSRADNTYMIDCEMLAAGCAIGDNITVMVLDSGDGYSSSQLNFTVTKAGFDTVDNLTLNSLPVFDSIVVDDAINLTTNEIDLVANDTIRVDCEAVVTEYEGDALVDIDSAFYASISFFVDGDDNNYHYSNSSCFTNSSYGNENQTQIICSYDVFYYANYDSWTCEIHVSDGKGVKYGTDLTNVNSLLSIEIVDGVEFTGEALGAVSNESEIVVNNLGNVEIDLNLWGYGETPGDDLSMNCSGASDIPVSYQKYNLTSSTSGNLSLGEFESSYINLTGSDFTADFNLPFRVNDLIFDAYKSTFWRIYIPSDVSGSCDGNIVFGAVASV
jgi:hypothetical protein